jgi:hypothetical protein
MNKEKLISIPLSDSDIKEYLGNDCKILKYSELSKYNSIDELLPNVKDFCVLLYENSPNSGHWTCVCRPKDNQIVYFDSYGGYVDEPLTWTDKSTKIGLGEDVKYLSNLLNNCEEDVFYNKYKYQSGKEYVANCGRFVVCYILKMKIDYSLDDFCKFIMNECTKRKKSDDVVICELIP